MMVLIWLAPIMYTRDQFDMPLLEAIIEINPITYFVEAFQSILYWGDVPSLVLFLTCAVIALLFFVVGVFVFKHLEKNFAEVL